MKPTRFFAGFLGLCVVAVVLGGTWLARGNHPGILLFPVLGRQDEVRLSGRLLFEQSVGGSPLIRNLSRLLAPNWRNASIAIAFEGQEVAVHSGPDGDFEASFGRPPERLLAPGSYTAKATAHGVSASAQVQVIAPATPFLVISDFDDTLAETHVLDKRKFAEAVLLHDGQTQPPVEGMADWYRCMETSHAIPPGFALVSGSPVQYSDRIGIFLSKHRFPYLGLYLRNLGPKTLHDYKQPIIRKLLNEFPMPVVLVGDSGEHDPEVYRQIREEFPSRVIAVFIRDVGRSEDGGRFAGMYLFRKTQEARNTAEQLGLISKTCQSLSAAPDTLLSPNSRQTTAPPEAAERRQE